MAITLDNSTDTVDFGDAALKRKATNALETPGALDVAALKITTAGITFVDNTIMNTAPSMRREILKPYGIAYKGNHEHDPEIYRAKLLIQQACEAVNIPQFTSTTGYESDDLLGIYG
jgi:hypothetical protein